MDMMLSKGDPQRFFTILPPDWQEAIVPVWEEYKKEADIYVFRDGEEVIAGGIVFKKAPPYMTEIELEHYQEYLRREYWYIGYLYVSPHRRQEALGSKWLQALKQQHPHRSFWLTIEEEGLEQFYVKNGFKCVATSTDMDLPEWLFVYDGPRP